MSAPSTPTRDLWPKVFFGLHALHSVWYAGLYPHGVFDPDLLAYFVYFRNWITQTASLHDIDYFTVPKPLLVFGLGPLADASLAFTLTAVASAFLGSLLYLIGRETFGRTVGVLLSSALLLDIERATLTLRSSADLYLAILLFACIYASIKRSYFLSGISLTLAALVKPIVLPCTLHLMAVDDADRRRAWLAALIPLVALPLIGLSNYALLGSPLGPSKFFSGFDAVSEGTPLPTTEVIRFVLWVQLVKSTFVTTAPFGILGLILWLTQDKRRLGHPFFLVPLLFLGGYVAMSVVTPFVPFFRFFWTIQVWFLAFIIYGIVEVARRLAGERRLVAVGLAAGLLFFLVDDHLVRQLRYRHHFAGPFQQAMSFVSASSPTLTYERGHGETVLTPLAFLPYLLWQLDDARQEPSILLTAEQWVTANDAPTPDWVLYIPESYLTRETRHYVEQLVQRGDYEPRIVDGASALLEHVPSPGGDSLVRRPPPR